MSSHNLPLPDLDPARTADDLVRDINDYIDKAQAMVKNRDALLLVGLDQAVESLCTRILALNATEGKRYAEALSALTGRIDDLHDAMREYQQEVAESLTSLSNQRKATRAYGNTPTAIPDQE